MLKTLIAPLQKILLQKKLCPACTSDLTKIIDRKDFKGDNEFVTCKCGRIFVFDKELEVYRRALIEEVE